MSTLSRISLLTLFALGVSAVISFSSEPITPENKTIIQNKLSLGESRAEAKQKKLSDTTRKRDYHLNKFDEHTIQKILKKTTLTEEEATKCVDKGMSEEDILSCYVIWAMVDKDFESITEIYRSEGGLEMTLKDFDIKKEDFDQKYAEIIPTDEDLRPQRDRVPWLRAPIRD